MTINSTKDLTFENLGPYSDYMYDSIAKILKEVGPRGPCTPAEKKAANLVEQELKQFCDEAHQEEFKCYPRAFLGWIRLDVILLLISFAVFMLNFAIPSWAWAIPSAGFVVLAAITFLKQFFKYEEWTPKWLPYKQGTSQNIVGTFKPTGEVKKRVVFGGHLDSAWRFNLIQYTKAGYAYFFFGGVLALVTFLVLYVVQIIIGIFQLNVIATVFSDVIITLLAWVVFLIPLFAGGFIIGAGKNKKIFFGAFRHVNNTAKGLIIGNSIWVVTWFILLWGFLFTSPLSLVNVAIFAVIVNVLPMIALFFFAATIATPGAVDNLTAVAECLAIAKILADWRKNNASSYPKNTEVVIAVVGCEEVGLRGSQAFATRHHEEYNKIDTTVVNFESISDSKKVTIFTEEKTTGTKLSPEVYNLLDEAAKELNINHNLDHMPGVAGGTDAAGFVRGGLKASSLCGLKYKDYLAYYHTDRDNLDLINKERRPWDDHGKTWQTRNIRGALEKSFVIGLRYLEKKDAQ